MSTLYDISRVAPALEAGDLVLTANRRLRNRIREAWAARQGAVGESPAVFALQEWLAQCWERLQNRSPALGAATVISELQAAQLWKEVIGAELGDRSLVNPRLVQQAAQAWRQLELWELPVQSLARYGEELDFPLLRWVPAFQARLAELELISHEESYRRILRGFESGVLPRLPCVWLESIPEQPPLLQRLLQAAAGQMESLPPLAPRDNVQQRFVAPGTEDEIRAAARWARQILQKSQGEAQTVIGIIVPDLGRSRDLVERIFTETFEAQYLRVDQPRYTLPFNISTGTPLGAAPIVGAALQLLKLNQGQTPAAELRQILNTPFWGDFESELGIRAALLNALMERGQLRYSASQLRSSAQALADGDCSEAEHAFARRLEAAGSLHRRLPAKALPGEWMPHVLALLEEIGWPGQRPLDSVEYQQVKQFYGLLEELASLDLLDSPMRLGEFLQILQQSAMSMPFQAEVRHSPIQILGSLEAEGLRFDHCWVLGMTSLAWPPRPEPNPLLPIALQRQHQMPRSSTARELAFAQALTEHYRRCADTVIFSHPLQVDEAQVMASPLIADIAVSNGPIGEEASAAASVNDLPAFYSALQEARRLEVLDCEYGPPLDIAPDETVRGGAALLQLQARCPFDAFATLRLGARAPAQPAIGLDAADKGSALHAVMALIWEQLKDREGLLAQSALPALVGAAVDRVFADLGQGASFELGPRYLELEKDRLCDLVLHFLDLEKARPPFEVVAMEEERVVHFAGLNFRLRIDRVDRCESGGHLIIDYKSGNAPNPRQWLGERPDEPQLPLYALTWPEAAAGIAFACIRARDPGYCGLVDESLSSWDKGIKTVAKQLRQEDASWQALLSGFESTLGRLARDYQAGHAAVDVQNPSVATRFHAHLLPLNRYGEADFIAFYLEGRN